MPFLTQKFRPFTLASMLLSLLVLTSCGGGGTASTSTGALNASSDTQQTAPPPSTPTDIAPSGSSALQVAQYTFKAQASGLGTSPMTTPAVTTPASGSLILVQVLTQNPGTFAGLTDNKGNTYVNIGGAQTYAGNAGSYLYACVNAVGGANQTWSLTKPSGYGSNEASIYVVVISGASGIGAWSYSNTRPYSGSAITTSAANSLVVSFWGPSDYTGGTNSYTPPSGWTKGNSNTNASNENTGADAWALVPNAGASVNPIWTSGNPLGSSGTDGSMWLVEVKPQS